MCSQIEAEPGPPLKAKVIGPAGGVLHAVQRVGRVAELGDRLILLLVVEDQPADGGGVLQGLAGEFDLMLGLFGAGCRDGDEFLLVVLPGAVRILLLFGGERGAGRKGE